MTTKQYLNERKKLLAKMEAVKLPINKRYTELTKQYIESQIPYRKNKVYEVVANGIRRKGFKRIVVYAIEINFINTHPMIRIGGWWLDNNHTPSKWETMVVYGAANSAVLKLSDNQLNKKVPKHLK